MRKTGILLLVIGTLLFIFLAATTYRQATTIADAPARRSRIINRVTLLERIRDQLHNAVIAGRGYLLTGEESYLEPYNEAIPVIRSNFKEIRSLHVRQPATEERLNNLEALINKRFGILATSIDLRRRGAYTPSSRSALTAQGAALDKEITIAIDGWVSEDIDISERLGIELSSSLRNLTRTEIAGVALTIFLVVQVLLLNRARNRAILDKHKAEHEAKLSDELAKTHKFFLHILDTLPGPVMYLNNDFFFQHCNQACGEPWGRSGSEVIGKSMHDILPSDSRLIDALMSAKDKGVSSREIISVRPPSKPDEERLYDISFTLDKDPSGAVVGILAEGTDVTELVKIQRDLDKRVEDRTRELTESRALLTDLIDNSPAVIYFKETTGKHLLINREFEKLFNRTKKEVEGKTDYDLFPKEIADAMMENDRRVLEKGNAQRYEETVFLKQSEARTYLSIKFPLRKEGKIYGLAGISTDITDRKQAEERIAESEANLRAVLEGVYDAIFIHDENGKIIDVNKKMLEMYGLTYEQAIESSIIKDLSAPDNPLDRLPGIWNRTMSGETVLMEWNARRPSDGIIFPVEVFLRKITLKSRVAILASVHDMTDRKKMEDVIRHQAHHDALTDLPNRLLFSDLLILELAQARRNRKKMAILFLDLDRFKEINDTLGHDVGDQLLKEVAHRLRETIRESDTVARIGGDEFNIILADITRPEDIGDIAGKIISRFRSPFLNSGRALYVTTSIGISIYPDDGNEIESLLRYADMAMYDAKEKGRNMFQFYNPAINVRSIERMRLEQMLRRSIERNELLIHYQPQINIRSKEMICAEALVRWQHPERGFLTPDQFLSLAEETGFITEIDDWALKTVCSQMRTWLNAGLPEMCITVNLSSRRFERQDLVGRISALLKEYRISAQCLDIEITENTAMRNIENTAVQLRELRAMGIHISIDDFGTGYSSLSYLKKLPIEHLKIDKSFVVDIATDPDDRAIISAVTSMARKMGIRTIAEGVETEEQLSFLRSADCDEAQGFLISRPVNAEEFRDKLAIR